jgi:BsuBI/PstI restriction endonuclease domain/BsuBI/PstI restriction endonuclease HTH domain
VAGARTLLRAFGFDAEQSNERSALVLLVLLGLRPGESWDASSNDAYGVTPIMDRARLWGRTWAPNTRETVRRFSLHQFVASGLVEYNHDRPDRPVNSPRANYRVSPAALRVIRAWGTGDGPYLMAEYLVRQPGQVEAYRMARELERIPVTLPGGEMITLSPGGQNVLIRDMVEEFCPRFTPGGQVLYLGDADSKLALFDERQLAALGVAVDHHGKLPDLVVWLPRRGWIVLAEAASSHGPVDAKRHAELKTLFAGTSYGLVFVSCFPNRAVMRSYLSALAWETEAWCASAPDHLIHFNGDRFLGPY